MIIFIYLLIDQSDCSNSSIFIRFTKDLVENINLSNNLDDKKQRMIKSKHFFCLKINISKINYYMSISDIIVSLSDIIVSLVKNCTEIQI